jgi:hypothetical protein
MGLPAEWVEKNAELTFTVGYQSSLAEVVCKPSILGGMRVSYSGGIPLMTDPSITFNDAQHGTTVVTVAAAGSLNGVPLISPTSYSGPSGHIDAVRKKADLQAIYLFLMEMDLKSAMEKSPTFVD